MREVKDNYNVNYNVEIHYRQGKGIDVIWIQDSSPSWEKCLTREEITGGILNGDPYERQILS